MVFFVVSDWSEDVVLFLRALLRSRPTEEAHSLQAMLDKAVEVCGLEICEVLLQVGLGL